MKTTKLFLALAVSSIVALSANATPRQLRLTLLEGINTFANPFSSASRNINDVLPESSGIPDGSVVHTWDANKHAYVSGAFFIEGAGWYDFDLNPSNLMLAPYAGALIVTPRNAEVVLTEADVAAASPAPAPALDSGASLRSVPAGMTLEEACPAPMDGDTIVIWSAADQRFCDPLTYLGDIGVWITPEFEMVEPFVAPGVAFFYSHRR